MELENIIDKKARRDALLKEITVSTDEVKELRKELDEVEDKIAELEDEAMYLENELDKAKEEMNKKKEPLRQEIEKLEWELGIQVSKDQLRLFEFDTLQQGETNGNSK